MKPILAMMTMAVSMEAAEMVLRNGKIVTLDPRKPEVQALAATGGKIVATGTNQQMAQHITKDTRVIDLGGKLAIPGFIDGHGHFTGLGGMKMMLNLRGARDWDQIVAMVGAAAKEAKPGDWIVGRGWYQAEWEKPPSPNVNGYPVHDSLSRVTPRNPVLLTHTSGHAGFANAEAIRRAGVTKDTQDPPGGEIAHDANGNPTGFFSERAQGLIRSAMAREVKPTPERAQREIDLATVECLQKGITSFQDAGSSPETIALLKERAAAGKLGLRMWVMLRTSNAQLEPNLDQWKLIGFGDDHLTVRAIKRQIDGALGSRGAWLLDPYSDLPTTRGLNTEDPKDLEKTAEFAIQHGFQYCVHAIGDRGNREILDMYERVFKAHPDKKDLRWRIEHAQHIDKADIPRFGKLGVIASMQGVHCTSDAPMVVPRLGPKRAEEGAYAWQSLMKSGAHVSNGTDAPVEDVSPIGSYYSTVSRKLKNGQVFYPAQRMTRMEALKSYTIECAYAAFEEKIKGSLEVGKLADVTVLSSDILTIAEDDIPKTQVEYTIVGGKVAYQRGGR